MRVLWFERDGVEPRDPADYPAAVGRLRRDARSADAGGLVARRRYRRTADARAHQPRRRRARDRRARTTKSARCSRPCARAGALGEAAVDFDADMSDALAAAFHAFIANPARRSPAPSSTTSPAKTIATNLPGTDRERPNWRRRHPFDVETLLAHPRGTAILQAMAAARTELTSVVRRPEPANPSS